MGRAESVARTLDDAQFEAGEWELKCPVCGEPMQPTRIAEDKPYDGKTAYAISKFATERMVLNYGKQYDIPSVALRYSVTYGPRQSIFNPDLHQTSQPHNYRKKCFNSE